MRTRLTLVLCLVAARLVAQQALFPQPPGLQTYTFRESMKKNVEATLDTIKALGFKEVECGAFPGKTIAESRRLLDERGIRCTSFGAGSNLVMA